jgi:methionyl-tRNA formyltransferase
MGTPDYATVILERLVKQKYEIAALFTQPDKLVGRKQVMTPPHIKQYCLDNKLEFPIYQPVTLKEESVAQAIRDLKPDFIIVAAYGQILPKNILDIAPCINLHASLLPKYRGASPIQEALLNDDEYSGVTAMLMEEGLDSGDILGLKYFRVPKDMLVQELFAKLSNLAADITVDTLDSFDSIEPKKQNEAEVSYCKKIKKGDGEVSFEDAYKLYLKYRAYHFWPGLFLKSSLKLKEIEFIENDSVNAKGEILSLDKESITVGCKKGSLKIKALQPASKKAMDAADYARGQRLEIGDILI